MILHDKNAFVLAMDFKAGGKGDVRWLLFIFLFFSLPQL